MEQKENKEIRTLKYKSDIAPLELYKNQYGQYFLYVNKTIKIITKDEEYIRTRMKDFEDRFKGLNRNI